MTNQIEVSNIALEYFASETHLEHDRGYIVVHWKDYYGNPMKRRWMVRGGQDFYPVWSHKWGHGGTCCTALSQLVRWCQGKLVLPLSSWKYWCSDKIGLARDKGNELVNVLKDGGYPEKAHCVLCGSALNGFDWWHLARISGPCCPWTEGCRQEVRK